MEDNNFEYKSDLGWSARGVYPLPSLFGNGIDSELSQTLRLNGYQQTQRLNQRGPQVNRLCGGGAAFRIDSTSFANNPKQIKFRC